MAAVAVTNTFAANTYASSSQTNTNFSDLVTYINNRNDGSATWDRCLVTSSSAVPLIVNNSTGTSNIVNFQDNGTNVLSIVDGGATRFADGTALLPSQSYLSDVNTGLFWISADAIGVSVGGVEQFRIIKATANANWGFGMSGFGSGEGLIALVNISTLPSSNPSGGGFIYVESGALKYRGSSGTITTLGAA